MGLARGSGWPFYRVFFRRTETTSAEYAFPGAARVMLLRPGASVANPAFETATADLFDEAAIDRLVAGFTPDLVLHLAGQASSEKAAKAVEETWRVNFHGALGLGAAVARHALGAVFLFASSARWRPRYSQRDMLEALLGE